MYVQHTEDTNWLCLCFPFCYLVLVWLHYQHTYFCPISSMAHTMDYTVALCAYLITSTRHLHAASFHTLLTQTKLSAQYDFQNSSTR